MSLFSEIERTIERGFRRWTERMFGEAHSDELLLVHRGILEEVEGKVKTAARGRRVFPYTRLCVSLRSPDADRRALYHAAFAEGNRLETDIREMLERSGCTLARGFAVEVVPVESADTGFEIDYRVEEGPRSETAAPAPASVPVSAPAPASGPGRLIVVRGKTTQAEYPLEKPRTNLGRIAELTDSDERVVRRNDVIFEEGADEANSTVSRRHAHIRLDSGEYRICDDGSEFGTRVFREGRAIDVPAGNRRGERLRPGDEIYLGRACLRFER